ncbi:hypothetical protein BC829DRAFT_439662 [Chytridium lagenaria]|nr:hypothetical protein BC829DRAFT_439662 [Chytridium lagenaria]
MEQQQDLPKNRPLMPYPITNNGIQVLAPTIQFPPAPIRSTLRRPPILPRSLPPIGDNVVNLPSQPKPYALLPGKKGLPDSLVFHAREGHLFKIRVGHGSLGRMDAQIWSVASGVVLSSMLRAEWTNEDRHLLQSWVNLPLPLLLEDIGDAVNPQWKSVASPRLRSTTSKTSECPSGVLNEILNMESQSPVALQTLYTTPKYTPFTRPPTSMEASVRMAPKPPLSARSMAAHQVTLRVSISAPRPTRHHQRK